MQKFTVTIVGKEFTIIGREDEKRVKNVAKIVEKEYLDVDKAYPSLSISDKAFLTAMTITDNSFENSNANLVRQQQEKINTLVNDIIDLKEELNEANNAIVKKQDENDVLKYELKEKNKLIDDLNIYLDNKEQEIDNIANDSLIKQREVVNLKEQISELQIELDKTNKSLADEKEFESEEIIEQDLNDKSNDEDIAVF